MPKVSIILPVHNGADYIKEAVNSVLTQTFTDFDLYVLDDGSSDNTVDILQSITHKNLKIVVNETNKGLIYTLNKGLKLSADYKYVARMDADDICLPNRLSATLDVLDNNPKVGVAGTSVTYFGTDTPNKDVILPHKNDCILPAFLCRNPIIHPTVMMRNKVLQDSGITYNADYYKYEDYKLWIDLFNKCEFYNTPEIHFMYRRHANSVSNVNNYKIAEDLEMVNKILLSYARAMEFELTQSELYTISVIASTYRWQIDLAIPLADIYTNVHNIVNKHNGGLVNKKYLTHLLWERVLIYLLKAKRYTDFIKLISKLGTKVNYTRILKIHKNWY